MIIVCDASPLTNLAAIGQFQLLHEMFSRLHVACGVVAELGSGGRAWPGHAETTSAEWIEKHEIQNIALAKALERDLDRGESESIALALELAADLVLLDEREGRQLAERLGLRVVGVVGILLEAKERGLIPAVRPLLDALRERAGFWLSDEVYSTALGAAGESRADESA